MIESMKFDMGGAAAVLGAADALAAAKPTGGPTVHLIAACCENLIGPDSLLPGDILTTAAGKTVEVNNTDAEGRLILADAMWYAQSERVGAGAVVDIATLTGACMVGLGQGVAACYTPEEATAEAVRTAARATGEKVWRMPLEARCVLFLHFSFFLQTSRPAARALCVWCRTHPPSYPIHRPQKNPHTTQLLGRYVLARRGHEERGRPLWWVHHRRSLPPEIRGTRRGVGASGHCGPGLG